jgi:hypothetical protein
MIRQALSLYRRHFGALVVTGALAIAPASLLEGGSLHAVLPRLQNHGDASPDKQPRVQGQVAGLQRFGFPQVEPARPLEAVAAAAPFVYTTFSGVLLLALGAWLALAAVSAVVFEERFSPGHAWGVAFSRLGPLLSAIFLSCLLIALGSIFFLIPGAVLAVGLAFSVPAVMQERLSGRAAMHRSWHLARDAWPSILLLLLVLAACSAVASGAAALVPEGPVRPLVATVIRCLTWPLPLAALALAYRAASRRS